MKSIFFFLTLMATQYAMASNYDCKQGQQEMFTFWHDLNTYGLSASCECSLGRPEPFSHSGMNSKTRRGLKKTGQSFVSPARQKII
jgi:hypothetical protein